MSRLIACLVGILFACCSVAAIAANPAPAAEKWQPVSDWFSRMRYTERELSDAEFMAQLKSVTTSINKVAYRTETGDVWLNPHEFSAQGYGDCEDFAIAKMHLLAVGGVPLNSMEVWLLTKGKGMLLPHAVLAIKRNGRVWLLDNFKNYPYREEELLKEYRPRYAVSVSGWRLLKKDGGN